MLADLGIVELRCRRQRSQGIDGVVREMPVQEGWYTEEQAMWVTTQSSPQLTRHPSASYSFAAVRTGQPPRLSEEPQFVRVQLGERRFRRA